MVEIVFITLKDCYKIQENIDAQERAIKGKSLSGDFILLTDTKSILVGIQEYILEKAKGG